MTIKSRRLFAALCAAPIVALALLGSPAAEAQQAPVCPTGGATVTDAYKFGNPNVKVTGVEVGDKIVVVIDKPEPFFAEVQKCPKKDVLLVVNGQQTGNKLVERKDGALLFILQQAGGTRTFWNTVLGRPGFTARPITVSVAIDQQQPLPSDQTLQLTVLPTFPLLLWAAIFILITVVFFLVARRSKLLRDPLLDPDAPPEALGAFSLSKVQGAVWFFIILASYLLIGIVTGDFSNSFNDTALILLGIGAGTVLGSAAIDASKLNQRKTELTAAKRDLTDKQKSSTATAQEVTDAKAKFDALNGTPGNFITDILSDGNGVNFHRFQLAAWTVVLSVIFIKEVYADLAMPSFNTTLMGLLGLSAGTYLGLKIPEPTKPNA